MKNQSLRTLERALSVVNKVSETHPMPRMGRLCLRTNDIEVLVLPNYELEKILVLKNIQEVDRFCGNMGFDISWWNNALVHSLNCGTYTVAFFNFNNKETWYHQKLRSEQGMQKLENSLDEYHKRTKGEMYVITYEKAAKTVKSPFLSAQTQTHPLPINLEA